MTAAAYWAGMSEAAMEDSRAWTDRPLVMVAGLAGRTEQALEEARTAAGLGYHAGLLSLAAMRADLDRGEPVDAVMKRHRVFFREEGATTRALRAWPAEQLAKALTHIRAAERAVMAPANAGTVLAEQAVETIARAQARRR